MPQPQPQLELEEIVRKLSPDEQAVVREFIKRLQERGASAGDYAAAEEERAFMRAVVAGLADVDAGREFSLAEAKARLGLP